MNTSQIIEYLEEQKQKIDRAIAALNGLPKIRRGRGKRTMSAAARRRISQAQKKRWAKQKRATKA